MATTATAALLLLLLTAAAAAATLTENENCVYTLYIRTSKTWKAGTDSVIGVRFYDEYGTDVEIPNLTSWGGIMGPFHNYFEKGNLDIFTGRAPCLPAPICAMNLTSDGSGEHHGWYCNYVEVTATGHEKTCSMKYFKVEQWLARDASPYQLFAIRNDCRNFVNEKPGSGCGVGPDPGRNRLVM